MRRRAIGIVGYDGVQATDVAGPADVFSIANLIIGGETAYDIRLLSLKKGPVATESGLAFYSDATLSQRGLLDTIIVPGGHTLRLDNAARTEVARWLRRHCSRARRIASVCTGIYALAESGLLDGRAATTHWRFAGEVQRRWPRVRLNADAIFIKDGMYYTSAGITAGIDLCLAFIEEDLGKETALRVAREMVVYLKRSGGQLQYSQPLLMQTRAHGRFDAIAQWIRGNLSKQLTVETMAERASLSPRHFTRKFHAAFGLTPADFVEEMRLDEARWLLVNAADPLAVVASEIGYSNDDTFRRAFERRFGIAPAEYRRRFGASAAS